MYRTGLIGSYVDGADMNPLLEGSWGVKNYFFFFFYVLGAKYCYELFKSYLVLKLHHKLYYPYF